MHCPRARLLGTEFPTEFPEPCWVCRLATVLCTVAMLLAREPRELPRVLFTVATLLAREPRALLKVLFTVATLLARDSRALVSASVLEVLLFACVIRTAVPMLLALTDATVLVSEVRLLLTEETLLDSAAREELKAPTVLLRLLILLARRAIVLFACAIWVSVMVRE